jgi:hypothetical protein
MGQGGYRRIQKFIEKECENTSITFNSNIDVIELFKLCVESSIKQLKSVQKHSQIQRNLRAEPKHFLLKLNIIYKKRNNPIGNGRMQANQVQVTHFFKRKKRRPTNFLKPRGYIQQFCEKRIMSG